MKRLLLSLALLLPIASFAGGGHRDPAQRIAKALQLSEADAARLENTLSPYRAQTKPLKDDLKSQVELLRKASAGDPAATGQVDQAMQKIYADRAQLASLRQQMFQAASAGLNPAQKAKLAVVMFTKHGRGRHGGRR